MSKRCNASAAQRASRGGKKVIKFLDVRELVACDARGWDLMRARGAGMWGWHVSPGVDPPLVALVSEEPVPSDWLSNSRFSALQPHSTPDWSDTKNHECNALNTKVHDTKGTQTKGHTNFNILFNS